MKTRYLVAILAAFHLASCSSSVDGPELAGPGSMAPIVTGIRITDETGRFVGNWGNPTDGPDEGTGRTSRGLAVLAPNPCVEECPIRYTLERSATVRLWVVPARLAGASGPDMESVVGAYVAAPRLTVVKTIDSGSMRPAGQFTMKWDATDEAGRRVPSGFYRIFLSIDGTLFWRDLLLVDTYEDVRNIILGD